ncbi:dTDP-4-amino-4,6-dideoxygalactose transaminase [Aeromicrobium sp. 9AM]|uniref:dTDP-4-amino-4,6-dideoxygalactose transaminase n=1 Tax=Aeromicrobium sp. 9AM TaxID=2653126 RepID=UPI0012F32A6F|nr:dTDP-4-amino-4,6-dideoxygalactose transaminase [Aeromicrobium sp. 9AM]VXC35909.1 TDP-4-oxo-6-deoxy-D-glucose transaminase [Aeromicrobium sp. 9AM]
MIPFNIAHLTGREEKYLAESMSSRLLTGDGPFTERASKLISGLVGGGATLLTTSCTHALEMTALLLDLAEGDEVIMPSFTFVSTANAYVLRGATPVFVDCRPDTLNIDERLVEAAITPRTKAIVVVHYGGVACEMDEILAIARRHGVPVIEDNAHGFGGTYRGRALGSLGSMATQSFHATKNIQCGEGGALVLNEPALFERAEIIREKGTNRGQFFRGMVDKYRWVDVGSSYLPSDLLAAFLTAQLEGFDAIQKKRMRVWDTYHGELAAWAADNGVATPTIAEDREHPAHLYFLVMPDHDHQRRLIRHLGDAGILGVFHYVPLDSAPVGVERGRTAPGGCPVTADVSQRLVRLPLFPDLSESDQARVIDAVTSFELA